MSPRDRDGFTWEIFHLAFTIHLLIHHSHISPCLLHRASITISLDEPFRKRPPSDLNASSSNPSPARFRPVRTSSLHHFTCAHIEILRLDQYRWDLALKGRYHGREEQWKGDTQRQTTACLSTGGLTAGFLTAVNLLAELQIEASDQTRQRD